MIFTVSYEACLPNTIDGGTAFQFSENETATVCSFRRFYVLRVSASKISPKRMQLSLIFLAAVSD